MLRNIPVIKMSAPVNNRLLPDLTAFSCLVLYCDCYDSGFIFEILIHNGIPILIHGPFPVFFCTFFQTLADDVTIAVIKQAAHNRTGTDPFISNEDKLTVKAHL